MTQTQTQILELFDTLDADERRKVAEHLYDQTRRPSFDDRMSPEQRAQLQDAIAQADRGEVVASHEVFDRLAQRFGFVRA